MNFFKYILIITLFYGAGAAALDSSNLKTGSASVYTHDEVELNAQVNIPYGMTGDLWFEYGTYLSDLNKKTQKKSFNEGVHISFQKITDLSAETKYYFNAVLQVEGETYKTTPREFMTLRNFNALSIGGSSQNNEGVVVDKTKPVDIAIKNPFDYFKRNNNSKSTTDASDNSSERVDQIEGTKNTYQDEPVGGVIHKESAYYNDERGGIVEYSDEYRNAFKQKKKTNPFLWLILIIFIGVIVFLYKKVYGSQSQNNQGAQKRIQRLNKYRRPQYYKDHQDAHRQPAQQPNQGSQRTFFRKPPFQK